MNQSGIHSILAAVDLEEGSGEVLRSAARLALAVGAELHVLHVVDLESRPYGEGAGEEMTSPARMARAEQDLQDEVWRTVPQGVPVHLRAVDNVPYRAILMRADQVGADLIVLGPHRGDPAARFLGTTADRIVRTAEVPCLIVRAPLTLPLRRIGVPVDFSVPSLGALGLALSAAERGAGHAGARVDDPTELVVFHVGTGVGPGDRQGREGEIVLRLEEETRQALEGADADLPVTVRSEVLWDAPPITAITTYAAEVGLDLLVMGTHGRGVLPRLLLGSVASGVAREAPCPVLLVPPTLARRVVAGPDVWAARARLERVLVAIDLAEVSMKAATWTARHFASGADLHVVHVLDVERPPEFLGGPTDAYGQRIDLARQEAETRVDACAREFLA